jgi:hypothetical protein
MSKTITKKDEIFFTIQIIGLITLVCVATFLVFAAVPFMLGNVYLIDAIKMIMLIGFGAIMVIGIPILIYELFSGKTRKFLEAAEQLSESQKSSGPKIG